MFLLTMMQHTNMLRRFSVALGVGGKEKCGKTYEFFLRKGSSNNCIIVKIVFFYFLHQTYTETRTGFFLFSLIMHNSSVPNFCKSFAFGTVLCKNVIALADVFPISCQWKDISV